MQSIYAEVTKRLESLSDTPALDASVLLAHIIEKTRTYVIAHPELELTAKQQEKLNESLDQLGAGDPLPYVLEKWEFFGFEFDVTKDVLIPRPETELLVEKTIAYLQISEKKSVADIGTGSGAIAISIAANVPNAQILATDISPAALNVAKGNAQKHNVQNQIQFTECDLLPTLNVERLTLNVLCANLPYIPTETMRGLSVYGREPTLALDGGLDGLNLFRKLFQLAPAYLASQSVMLLEIESTLGAQTVKLASDHFPNAKINLYQDLAGKDRLLEIQT